MRNLIGSVITFIIMIHLMIHLTGCATTPPGPDLDLIYTRSASYTKPNRNPVIVIPGALGSKLVDRQSKKIVWGAFTGGHANPSTPEGMRSTALPMKIGSRLNELKDSVESDGALDRLSIRVFLVPVRLNAYYNILKIMGVGGYRDEDMGRAGTVKYPPGHYTSFQFDYDWRRDIVENARLLDEFIEKQKAKVQKEIEERFGIRDQEVKFNIVAHSMGGVLARYYLRHGRQDLPEDGSKPDLTWEGAKNVEKVVMIGTPNAGSVFSLKNLVNGFHKSRFLPRYEPALVGTMPAFYQLMPHSRHKSVVKVENGENVPLDIFDIEVWKEFGWGLASPKQDRVMKALLPDVKDKKERHRIALDHLEKCLLRAKRFLDVIDDHAEPPEHVSFHLFAGDAVLTDAVVEVDSTDGSLKVIEKLPGDGTVTRASALMDERLGGEWTPKLVSPIKWSTVMFLFTNHIGMTEDPSFSDNLLYYLLEHPD